MKLPALALCFLLGAWSCGTVFMWQTAIQNFAVAEAVETSTRDGAIAAAEGLAPGSLRALTRYQASEVNRLFFGGWGWVQLGLGALALAAAWLARCGRAVLVLVGAMGLIAVGMAVYVVPETVRLGRLMDFAAEGSLLQVEGMFWTLHHTYTGLDMLKFALGLVASALVCRRFARGTAPS